MTIALDDPAALAAGRATSAGFRKLVAASCFGTSIEWYDFFLYSFLGPLVFDKLFFPSLSPFLATLVVWATLAVGLAARPIGGILFGELGDRVGRKPVLFIALCIMGLSTAAMGLLPGYAIIGAAAPVLLILLRIVQGLALGGEYSGALLLTVESAPDGRRGFFSGFIQITAYIGVILASGAIALLSLMSRPDLLAWGWRLPFLASLILLVVAAFIRRNVGESAAFEKIAGKTSSGRVRVLEVFARYPMATLVTTLISAAESGFYYLVSVFALAYGTRTLGHSQGVLSSAVVIGASVGVFTCPLLGSLSDRLGRRPIILAGTLAAGLYVYLFFALMKGHSDLVAGLAIVAAMALIHPLMYAPQGSFLAEQFETKVRMTGISLGKQFGVVLGSGVVPLVSAWIIGANHGQTTGVVVYFGVMAALAFAAALFARETHRVSLQDRHG